MTAACTKSRFCVSHSASRVFLSSSGPCCIGFKEDTWGDVAEEAVSEAGEFGVEEVGGEGGGEIIMDADVWLPPGLAGASVL